MDEILEQAFRYSTWANLRLLDVCDGLQPDQLQLTASGTYGTIAATWMHLLSAEQRYLRRFGGPVPELENDDRFPGVEVLKAHAARSGDALLEAARTLARGESKVFEEQGERHRLSLWVVAVQALHHGNDHRTHICTILGAHGIDCGDMDVWAYGYLTGHEVIVDNAG